MRYLIDGYNLVYAMGLLSQKKAAPGALEAARFDLLDHLHALFGDQSGCLTVIFDANRVPRHGVPEHDYHGLHVRFAVRQQADDLIETLVQSEGSPKSLTVVSDDHRVQTAARRRQCPVLGCNAFLDVAERPARQTSPTATDANAKPDAMSPAERQRWLDEFADFADDPALKKGLNPGAFDFEE